MSVINESSEVAAIPEERWLAIAIVLLVEEEITGGIPFKKPIMLKL